MTARDRLCEAIEQAVDALDAFDRDAEAEPESAEDDGNAEDWTQPPILQWA